MHLRQCDVSEDRSLRHCGVNDIKRPGIQPQPIHMQMDSLALTLINSLWVHSFPVNKDLAAFEWSGTLSGERERTGGNPPYSRAPPPTHPPPGTQCNLHLVGLIHLADAGQSRCWWGDKRKQHSCFLFHPSSKSPPKAHDWTEWMTWDWASQELCARWTLWMRMGHAAL